jgi:predicted metal-dependent peptidase
MSSTQPVAAAPSKIPTITAAIRAKAEDNTRKAKVQLVLHQQFFASIILKRDIKLDDGVETAYCTAAGKIVMGTYFVSQQTVQKTMGLMAHEAMHYAMMHHIRRGWRKPRPANIAMDKVINDILKESGMELPDGGTFQEGAREYAWEQLYDESEQDGGGQGQGQGQGQYQPGTGNDDLSDEGVANVTDEQVEQIKQELIQAVQAAKSRGNIPAGLEQMINDIVNPPTPWHQLLERYMLMLIKAGQSWRRPNKRFACHDIYMPTQDMQPRMGTVVIQIDESGSVGMDERRHFFGHINKIIEDCRPERIILLHTDMAVAHVDDIGFEDMPIEYKNYACGGTDMTVGFDWVREQGIEPDVFVCLTDGETPFGEPPGYPVAWLITTPGIEADHGETIPYEVVD